MSWGEIEVDSGGMALPWWTSSRRLQPHTEAQRRAHELIEPAGVLRVDDVLNGLSRGEAHSGGCASGSTALHERSAVLDAELVNEEVLRGLVSHVGSHEEGGGASDGCGEGGVVLEVVVGGTFHPTASRSPQGRAWTR